MPKASTHDLMKPTFDWIHGLSTERKWWLVSAVSLCLVVIDYLTGYEFGFSLFYLLPVSMITWFISTRKGAFSAVVFALLWGALDLDGGHVYSNIWYPVWNMVSRIGFYVVVVKLLNAIKEAFERERSLSRTDGLTGVYNSRHMTVQIHRELERYKRYDSTFSLAYIDLDNFKNVNDTFGHAAGNEVLKSVSNIMATKLRKTDIIGRMGGDEFVILLPGTDLSQAKIALNKLEGELLQVMKARHWPVTFSMGLVTPQSKTQEAEELLERADALMYQSKKLLKESHTFAA